MKKTLDFWEQGNIYPKEVVQYVKGSFLNQSKQDKGYYQYNSFIKKKSTYTILFYTKKKKLFFLKQLEFPLGY